MSIKIVWEAIETKLNSLIAWTNLKIVYNYEAKKSDVFPYASIIVKDWKEDVEDTNSNSATYNFIVRLVNANSNIAILESKTRELTDQVIDSFRADITLWGKVQRCLVQSCSFGRFDAQFPERVVEIQIEVLKNLWF